MTQIQKGLGIGEAFQMHLHFFAFPHPLEQPSGIAPVTLGKAAPLIAFLMNEATLSQSFRIQIQHRSFEMLRTVDNRVSHLASQRVAQQCTRFLGIGLLQVSPQLYSCGILFC